MEINGLIQKYTSWIKKYKYAVLVMLVGVVLMCLPDIKDTQETPQETTSQTELISIEEQLEAVLSQLQGAGKVKVMLTVAEGEKTVFQYDEDVVYGNDSQSIRKDTVTVTGQDRSEQALIAQKIPPVYLGAVIVCQGADKPAVKLAIVEAVSKITGLGSDKICVLKMK